MSRAIDTHDEVQPHPVVIFVGEIREDPILGRYTADRISLMDAMAHARDSNFVKEEFQKALKSQRKGWFAGVFKK
jgi:hypothetical protein